MFFTSRLQGSCAFRAGAEEFELVIEVAVASGELDLLFQLVHGAGSLDGLDGSALGANQVIAVLSGKQQGEVGCALMQTEAAQNTFVGKALKQAEYRGFITLVGKPW